MLWELNPLHLALTSFPPIIIMRTSTPQADVRFTTHTEKLSISVLQFSTWNLKHFQLKFKVSIRTSRNYQREYASYNWGYETLSVWNLEKILFRILNTSESGLKFLVCFRKISKFVFEKTFESDLETVKLIWEILNRKTLNLEFREQ